MVAFETKEKEANDGKMMHLHEYEKGKDLFTTDIRPLASFMAHDLRQDMMILIVF